MVCSNPDHVAPSGTELVIAPGTIAAMYEAMGGTVRYIGKPHAPIYGACLDALEGLELGEIVAVGNSLEHDIKGANNIGIASCFLTGGIHAGEFPAGASRGRTTNGNSRLATQRTADAATPDWVVPRLAGSPDVSEVVVDQQPAIPLVLVAFLGHRTVLGVVEEAAVDGDSGDAPVRVDGIAQLDVGARVLEAGIGFVLVEAAAPGVAPSTPK